MNGNESKWNLLNCKLVTRQSSFSYSFVTKNAFAHVINFYFVMHTIHFSQMMKAFLLTSVQYYQNK